MEELPTWMPYLASALAAAASLLNLYLTRRDRRPRLRLKARYEYRAGTGDAPGIHSRTQEGLYRRLGHFLLEHALAYPSGAPLVRFSVLNAGEKPALVDAVRLVVRPRFGSPLLVDPKQGTVLPLPLAGDRQASVQEHPAELQPGDAVGYRFELIALADLLRAAGLSGNVGLALEATDRAGRTHSRRFDVNTDLWGSPDA